MRKKVLYEKEERMMMMMMTTKSDFFCSLFLSSRVLNGTFPSILVNCQAVSFPLDAWYEVCSSLGNIRVICVKQFVMSLPVMSLGDWFSRVGQGKVG